MSKEAYLYGESDLFTWQKRPSEISIPEVCVCVSVKRGLPYGKRDLLYAQKRPTNVLAYLRYARVSKETYYMAKETYSYGKRDLFIWQKRPINISIPERCPSAEASSCPILASVALIRV